MKRRNFLISTAIAAVGTHLTITESDAAAAPTPTLAKAAAVVAGYEQSSRDAAYIRAIAKPTTTFVSRRPPKSERRFVSQSVDRTIHEISAKIADPELAWMFENCFPNPMDTTVDFSPAHKNDGKPDTFVLTGDIPAMWPRDTMYQMSPYMSLAKHDPHLREMLHGVINRMVDCVLISPYANAYLKTIQEVSPWHVDHTHMAPGVWEHKWELDTPCATIRMSHAYWRATGDVTPFDARWRSAMERIVDTFHVQQRLISPGPYRFQRKTLVSTDTLPRDGLGFPAKPVGLIYTMFRPSDDAVTYPLNIPDNLLAATSLDELSELYGALGIDSAKNEDCKKFSATIRAAVRKFGIVEHGTFGKVYAFEVDGFGNALFMDDAGWPGVLALPYLGACPVNDPIYQASRKLVWGPANPYFYKGKFEGIGSIHTPSNNIWPLSLIMYGLTATTSQQVAWALRQLKISGAGTGFIHESYSANDPAQFTRPWFAWANAMFGELVLHAARHYPGILAEKL